MRILSFNNFVKSSLLENIKTTDNIGDAYSLIALGVARAYGLLGYFISLAEDKVNPKEWEMVSDSISREKTYDGKWKKIISISKRLNQVLAEFSAEKYKDRGFKVSGIYDLGDESKTIPVALEKLKTASDILVKNLDEPEKMKLLSLLDKSISTVQPFEINVNETLREKMFLLESKQMDAPTATDVIRFAEEIQAGIINLKQTINNMSSLFSETKLSGLEIIKNDLDPMLEELERIMVKDFEPLKDEKVSNSVKKYYSGKGWKISTSLEQYMVDAWEKITEFNKELAKKANIVKEYKTGVIREFEPSSNAKQFIQSANDMFDKIEETIYKRKNIEYLQKRSGEVIAGSGAIPKKKQSQTKEIDSAQQLQDFIKKKYQK